MPVRVDVKVEVRVRVRVRVRVGGMRFAFILWKQQCLVGLKMASSHWSENHVFFYFQKK